jgi:hypothetical protein
MYVHHTACIEQKGIVLRAGHYNTPYQRKKKEN